MGRERQLSCGQSSSGSEGSLVLHGAGSSVPPPPSLIPLATAQPAALADPAGLEASRCKDGAGRSPSPPGCGPQPPCARRPSRLAAVLSSAALGKSQPRERFLTACLGRLKATVIKTDQTKQKKQPCQRPPPLLLILCQTLHVISWYNIQHISWSPSSVSWDEGLSE